MNNFLEVKQEVTKIINLQVDDKSVSIKEGSTILQAAELAGIPIPTLCHHPILSNVGACRLCVVEVEGARTLVPACAYPVAENMKVKTNTERVKKARKLVIDLLLSAHPLDCLTCEKNGNCELQKYAYEFGIEKSSFDGEKYNFPIDQSNPFIVRDYNKCILCGRCIRICDEIQGNNVVDFAYRGFKTIVSTAFNKKLTEANCAFCGQCISVCPVGALTEKNSRWKGREWELKKVTTICSYCGVGCQIDLNVKDNKIIKVTPSASNTVNNISLCAKGKFGFEYIQTQDRLKQPLIRKNGTSKGESSSLNDFVETTWESALDTIAKKLTNIIDQYGSDSIGILSSAKCTNEENYLMQKFARAIIGTNNIDHCARLCHSSTVAGLAISFGSGAMTNSIEELENAKCIFITGSNTTEAHPVIALKIKKAKQKGAKIIVADPRKIELSEIADVYLQHRPGTDVALLNGLMNVIISENLHKKEYIQSRCENYEEFEKIVLKYNLELVEKITGVSKDKLKEAAIMYASSDPASIVYSMGITQHTTGVDNVRSIANLAMLTGNVGKESSGVNPLRGQNNVQGACDMGALPNVFPGYQSVTDELIRKKFEQAWKNISSNNLSLHSTTGTQSGLPAKPGLTITEMMLAALEGKINALYIMGENPLVSDPDLNHVKQAMMKLDFLIVQDIFFSETAKFADVILPAVSFAEKDGTFTNTERKVQRIRKAIEPIGNSKPDWEIITLLANTFLKQNPTLQTTTYMWNYNSPKEIMEEISKLTPIYGGITYERIEKMGLQWPCPDINHPGTKFLHKDKFTRGKGAFYPVEFKEPDELPSEEYPYILTTGRMLYHFHTGTMTRKVSGLNELHPEGYIEINPEDAEALKIKDGSFISVESKRGKIKIKAKITERVGKGVVFIPFHFAETAANILTNSAYDPIAKIPELKVCAVKITPQQN